VAHTGRKKVVKIKDDCGLWIDDHFNIVEKFIEDNQLRFKSTHQGARLLPHLGLSHIISAEDN